MAEAHRGVTYDGQLALAQAAERSHALRTKPFDSIRKAAR